MVGQGGICDRIRIPHILGMQPGILSSLAPRPGCPLGDPEPVGQALALDFPWGRQRAQEASG